MSSLVSTYLNSGGTLASLTELYAVRVARHRRYPNLVGLKYSQIDSPMDNPMVRECRGIVLDEADHWRVVARGFDKFFNYGEPLAPAIDWSTAVCQEKLDGSLCLLYWYRDEWHVATTGWPDASGQVGPTWPGVFADLFWDTVKRQEISLPTTPDDPHLTYMLELMSPHNRIVVRHDKAKLALLGVRDTVSGQEGLPQPAMLPGALRPQSFPLQSIADILASFDQFNPLNQEGYVIVDAAFRRIKVKHPGYVALHHLRDSLAPRAFVDVIRRNEGDELRAAFPEFVVRFKPLEDRFDALVAELEADYERLKDIPVQKDFALEAVKTRFSAALFARRSNKTPSIRQFLANVSLDTVMRLLDVRDEPAAEPSE